MSRKRRYVKLVLRDEVVEERRGFSLLAQRPQMEFRRLVMSLESIRKSRRVQALVVVVKNLSLGWGQLDELREQLERLRASGKTCVAFLEQAGNQAYYLALACDRIWIAPPSSLELVGLRAESVFVRDLLDRIGVRAEIFSIGRYKTAGESLTRSGMSETGREMLESILDDLQRRLCEKLAARRGGEPGQAQEWIDGGPYTATQALKLGLVDAVCYEDEIEERLQPGTARWKELPVRRIGRDESWWRRILTFTRPQIAYLVAEGVITTGPSRGGRGARPIIGFDALASALRDIRKRNRIKAVVLRINSPGGSGVASDLLWREIHLTDQIKPVVASFGDVAASGGYYLATAARKILGLPGSLTGSIGVLGGKINIEGLLSKLQIGMEAVEKGAHAGYQSPARGFSEEEARIVRGQMQEFYEDFFLRKVADSRKMSIEEVRRLAEGRVWTGSQAAAHGLVDSLGGISDAIETARREAGISPNRKVRLVSYARRPSLLDLIAYPRLEALAWERVLTWLPGLWRIR